MGKAVTPSNEVSIQVDGLKELKFMYLPARI